MPAQDWSEPEYVLQVVTDLLQAPLSESLARFSAVTSEVLPHSSLLLLSGDCVATPLRSFGGKITLGPDLEAEMARLAGDLEVGKPWFEKITAGGSEYPVLAVAASPPGSAGSLLAAVLEGNTEPTASQATVFQHLWELMADHVYRLNERVEPAKLSQSRVAVGERTRVSADMTDAHSATLTAILSALRSRDLSNESARHVATEIASSSLVELRTGSEEAASEFETVDEAFTSMAQKLVLLMRYNEASLELSAPDGPTRSLSFDIASAARAAVRAAVLTLLDQPDVTRIRVAWNVNGDALHISVRDNGPGTLSARAFGRHRLDSILNPFGSTLELDPVPGWGTTLTIRVPLGVMETFNPPSVRRMAALNTREMEVLDGISMGQRNRVIARNLHISEHTVKYHVANILEKLQVSSRGEAAAVARKVEQ